MPRRAATSVPQVPHAFGSLPDLWLPILAVVIYVYFECQSMPQVWRPISAPQLQRDRTSGAAKVMAEESEFCRAFRPLQATRG
jgi:hypothetical protein